MGTDVVVYAIFGDDMQRVQVELDPGKAAAGELGALMMDDCIPTDTIFADRSTQ